MHKTNVIKALIVESDPDLLRSKTLMSSMKKETEAQIEYITAYKAIKAFKLKNNIHLKNSYECINGLMSTTNPESAIVHLQSENSQFKHLFFSWKAAQTFFFIAEK